MNERLIFQKIYEQFRRNQANGSHGGVDIIATPKYADEFHALLERQAKASSACPAIIKWSEELVLGMTCRTYSSQDIMFPRCEVHCCITTDYQDIFAIPDYQSGTYFCLLTEESRPFPKAENQPCQ